MIANKEIVEYREELENYIAEAMANDEEETRESILQGLLDDSFYYGVDNEEEEIALALIKEELGIS